MNLALATSFLCSKGGVERIVLEMAKHYKSPVFCAHYDAMNTFEGYEDVEVITLNRISKKTDSRLLASIDAGFKFYTKKIEGYDLINAHGSPSEWLANNNSPLIWYCHSPNREAYDLYEWRMKKKSALAKLAYIPSTHIFRSIEHSLVPRIDHIFTNSINVQKRIKKYFQRDSQVLYYGVDTEKYSSKEPENFFLYPSRIAPEKDIEFCIRAFEIFSKKNPGHKLIIAGFLSDRQEHRIYYRHLVSLNVENVVFETNISDEELKDLYSRCITVLYSPIDEDFGLVPLEAMASSKICIAKNEGGPKETIINSVDGFLVENPISMAERMQWAIKNSEKIVDMGKKGHEKVKKYFCWENFFKTFDSKTFEYLINR